MRDKQRLEEELNEGKASVGSMSQALMVTREDLAAHIADREFMRSSLESLEKQLEIAEETRLQQIQRIQQLSGGYPTSFCFFQNVSPLFRKGLSCHRSLQRGYKGPLNPAFSRFADDLESLRAHGSHSPVDDDALSEGSCFGLRLSQFALLLLPFLTFALHSARSVCSQSMKAPHVEASSCWIPIMPGVPWREITSILHKWVPS